MTENNASIGTSIAPWLSVQNGAQAVTFYKAAFDAVETSRLEDPGGGLVVKLSVNGAEFWLSGGAVVEGSPSLPALGGDNVRIILTVNDPDTYFKKALEAGATEVFPIGEEYGWRLGRIVDPFGLHWEIGYPFST